MVRVGGLAKDIIYSKLMSLFIDKPQVNICGKCLIALPFSFLPPTLISK